MNADVINDLFIPAAILALLVLVAYIVDKIWPVGLAVAEPPALPPALPPAPAAVPQLSIEETIAALTAEHSGSGQPIGPPPRYVYDVDTDESVPDDGYTGDVEDEFADTVSPDAVDIVEVEADVDTWTAAAGRHCGEPVVPEHVVTLPILGSDPLMAPNGRFTLWWRTRGGTPEAYAAASTVQARAAADAVIDAERARRDEFVAWGEFR